MFSSVTSEALRELRWQVPQKFTKIEIQQHPWKP